MRIISGSCKGRIINPPKSLKARPTTDFAKENLFNVLANMYDFEGLEVLDLFSGSGSISYEFASRGAKRVISIEKDPIHSSFIKQCAATLKLHNIMAVKSNVFVYLKSCKASKFDIIFADPPYEMPDVDTLPDIVMGGDMLNEDGIFILEHSKAKDYSAHPCFVTKRAYGSVNFSIFQSAQQEE